MFLKEVKYSQLLHLKHRSGQLKLKVDTGAKCNVISAQQLHLIVPAAHINTNEKVNLIAYGGQTINTEGTTILDCEQGQLKFHVVDRSVRPLLGLQDTIAMGLIQLGPHVETKSQRYIYIYIYAFSRRFYPKRLTLHSSYSFYILSALAFPGNRTHDLGVAGAMHYQLSYRKAGDRRNRTGI